MPDRFVAILNKAVSGANSEVLHEFNDGFCDAVAFSPTRNMAAHGAGARIHLWNTDDGQTLRWLERNGQSISSLAFSPDGTRLVSGDGRGEVQAWNVQTGELIRKVAGHRGNVTSVLFSVDGKHFITGSWDKTIGIWNVETGRELARATCQSHCTTALALSPDETYLASAGGHWTEFTAGQHDSHKDGDYAIRLWRLPASITTHSNE